MNISLLRRKVPWIKIYFFIYFLLHFCSIVKKIIEILKACFKILMIQLINCHWRKNDIEISYFYGAVQYFVIKIVWDNISSDYQSITTMISITSNLHYLGFHEISTLDIEELILKKCVPSYSFEM